MNPLRVQGILFCVLALLVATASGFFAAPYNAAGVAVLASVIVLFGVPHGALDTVFANRLYGVNSFAGWVAFTSGYLLLVGFTVLLWRLAPMAFLIGFLAISALHFSGDPTAGSPWYSRLLRGGAVIVLPALFHADEEGRLLALISGPPASASIIACLQMLSPGWLVAMIVVAIVGARYDWLSSLEMISTAGLALFAAPLLAFTLFFCGMHSARHILRTIQFSRKQSGQAVLGSAIRSATFPMLGALAIFFFGFFQLRHLELETRVIQVLFVGLAALTVPHMLLVERVRLTGWTADRA